MSLLFAENLYDPSRVIFSSRNQLTNYQTFSYFHGVIIKSEIKTVRSQISFPEEKPAKPS